ncbi:MAG: hypothetical protein AAFP90_09900 [Planctomycetota bacterium]
MPGGIWFDDSAPPVVTGVGFHTPHVILRPSAIQGGASQSRGIPAHNPSLAIPQHRSTTPAAGHATHHHLHKHAVVIPGATTLPTWKTPYSYGYFGAKPHAHWNRQRGVLDDRLRLRRSVW